MFQRNSISYFYTICLVLNMLTFFSGQNKAVIYESLTRFLNGETTNSAKTSREIAITFYE